MSAAGDAAKKTTIAAVEKVDDSVSGWLGDLISGEGDSPSHIIVNCILGCIPGVGQVIDIRDSILAIIALTGQPSNASAWLNLVLALIGWIPVGGDVIKNVFKAARSQKAVARILDMIPDKIAGDGLKYIKELDLRKIGDDVSGYATQAIQGFIGALDSFLVKTIGGRARINGYIDALKNLANHQKRMIDDAMKELEELRGKIVNSAHPNSTAAVGDVTTATAKAADDVAEAAGKQAGKQADKAGTQAGKQADKAGTQAGKQAPDAKPPKKGNTDTSKANKDVPTDSNKTSQTRKGKKKNQNKIGILGEHLTDFYVRESRQAQQYKINDFGVLCKETSRPKGNGIDHIWKKKLPGSVPFVVGETKATTRPGDIGELIVFMAALPADVKAKLEGMSSGGSAPEDVEFRDDATKDDMVKGKGSRKQGLGDTKTKGTQMSHFWIKESFLRTDRKKMKPAHGDEFADALDKYKNALFADPKAPAPYERWIILATKTEMDAHKNTRVHKVKLPVFHLPNAILSK